MMCFKKNEDITNPKRNLKSSQIGPIAETKERPKKSQLVSHFV